MYGKIKFFNHAQISKHKSLCSHHCGLCKSLGKEYGFTSRLFANPDAGLLQEMLGTFDSSITKEHLEVFSSYNCFRYPTEPLPESFKYSAAITVLMARLKIEDNVRDSKGIKKGFSKLNRQISRKSYQKANRYLESIGFPMDKVRELTNKAYKREVLNPTERNISLNSLSAHYGEIYGTVAEHGMTLLKQPHLQDDSYQFGKAFGRLIYFADAYLDLEKDTKQNNYNALTHAFGTGKREQFSPTHFNALKLFINENLQTLKQLGKAHDNNHILYLTDRIGYNLDLIFSTDPQKYSPGLAENMLIKWNSFVRQVRFHINQLPENKRAIVSSVLKKFAIVSFSLITVFLLSCYESSVPLSNKVDIGNSIVGKWGNANKIDFEIEKLNKYDYLLLNYGNNNTPTSSVIINFSEINGEKFINFPTGDEDEPTYCFLYVKLTNNRFSYQVVGDFLFEKGKLQFTNSEKLTNYFKTIMNSKYFYFDHFEEGPKETEKNELNRIQ